MRSIIRLASKLGYDLGQCSKASWSCLNTFRSFLLQKRCLRDQRASMKPIFTLLLDVVIQSNAMHAVVKSFAVDAMSQIRQIVSDLLYKTDGESQAECRALLDFAVSLQPYRRQIHIPAFRNALQVSHASAFQNFLAPPSQISEDPLAVSQSALSNSNISKKQLWQTPRTVSANSLKNRLAAISNSQSNFNSRIEIGALSSNRK